MLANETVDPAELRNRVLTGEDRSDAELFVVSPGRERLERSLTRLGEAGLDADGEVGDSDPVTAVGDALRKFDADEIVVVAHRGPHGTSDEDGTFERVNRRFHQQITELVMSPDSTVPLG